MFCYHPVYGCMVCHCFSGKLWYLQHSCVEDTIVYHWNSNVITTIFFCFYHDSCAVVACRKMIAKWFHWIWIYKSDYLNRYISCNKFDYVQCISEHFGFTNVQMLCPCSLMYIYSIYDFIWMVFFYLVIILRTWASLCEKHLTIKSQEVFQAVNDQIWLSSSPIIQ